jgi:glycosyltransferase involved in cell wall biosynthesis
MRILLVSQEVPPETSWGGIGTYVGIIAPALVRAGAEAHVLSVVEGQASGDRVAEGVQVHRRPLRRPRGIGRAVKAPLTWDRISLAAAVAIEQRRLGPQFDVCECPDWGAEGLLLALRRTLPLVVRLHSGASQVFPYLGPLGRDQRLAIRCEEAVVRRADVVTGARAQTSHVRRALALEPARVRTITYPVAPMEPLPPSEGPPKVLFAGRFEARKGPDVLLRAVPALLERVRSRSASSERPSGSSS